MLLYCSWFDGYEITRITYGNQGQGRKFHILLMLNIVNISINFYVVVSVICYSYNLRHLKLETTNISINN